ncbi:hypothetical protein [Leifsonia sp. Root4]|uniref:hypothetical protein n=1 Tax=Leifsonia sp. Root4 TaxID=1736525 RepID=UPI0012F865A9|nr:hypothetical protein [Leifsonia sp. Root4]
MSDATERMLRQLRLGLALVICAPVVVATIWMSGLVSVAADSDLVALAVAVLSGATVLALGIGLVLLIAAARTANAQALLGAVLSALGLFPLCCALLLPLALPSLGGPGHEIATFGVPALLVLLVVGALLALIGFTRALSNVQLPARREHGPTTSAQRARAGVTAFLCLLVLLAFGTYETLVLSPEQMAPDYTLAEIYAMLTPADRGYGIAMALIWLVFWVLAALLFFTLCLLRGRLAPPLNVLLTPRRVLIYALLLGSVIQFFQGWSGLSLGMSISDTVPPMVGGRSWQGQLLTVAGAAMFVAGVLVALAPGRARPLAPTTSAAPASRSA